MSAMAPAQIIASPLLAAGIFLLLAAALHDVATRTIPNRLVAGVACTGLACQFMAGNAVPAGIAGAAVLAVSLAFWRRGYLGGGDAKLLAAAALMVPANQILSFILTTAVAGGVLSLFYLVMKGLCAAPRPTTKPAARSLIARILRIERWRLRHGIALPYATAIAAGTVFVLWRG